jgi:hypothetical protein
MRITDIIRGILDQVDATVGRQQEEPAQPDVVITAPQEEPCSCEQEPKSDLVAIIQQLAGLPVATEPDYANEPVEVVQPIGAAFPGGDGESQRKNPADIRSNSVSMYPSYQAEKR